MTDKSKKKRKLFSEILIACGVSFLVSLLFFLFLLNVGVGLVERYCFNHDIILDEDQLYRLDSTAFSVSLIASVVLFIVLFFVTVGQKLAYIHRLIDGVNALQRGEYGSLVLLEGNNELTGLAERVNYLSESEKALKEKEARLALEKEELIRTLSHDIRTPLTSVISYTELMTAKKTHTSEETEAYLALVTEKTAQIKELTDILLDGGRRNLVLFDNCPLLMAQLTDAFAEALEDGFTVSLSLEPRPPFAATLDVRELQRIFDNLTSNIKKYADPAFPVCLTVSYEDAGIVIRQENRVREGSVAESYRMGLNSMRRIAQNYGGDTVAREDKGVFTVTVTLPRI